jgi:hypothetical protein
MHAGMTIEEVRQRFGEAGWQVVRAEPTSADPEMAAARRAAAHFEHWCYQIRRDSA